MCVCITWVIYKICRFLSLPKMSCLTAYGKVAEIRLSFPTDLKLQRPDKNSHET